MGASKSYQSCFATFTRKEDVRSPLYGARYHSSLPLLLTGSCPSRARKSASGILLTASISVLSMPVSVDDELDTDPELRVKLPRVATPKATLPQIGKQGYTVCHVAFHIERQRAAVDEGVPVVQRGAVMQHFLPPIHRLISGESRSPSIDEHDFSGVRQYLEVISAIRRELRNGLTDTEKTAMNTYGADMSKYDASGNEARLRAAYENRDPRLAAIAITPYSTYDGGASGSVVTYTSRYPYRDWQAPSLDLRYGNNAYMLYPIRKFVTKGREYTNIGYNPVDVPIIRYADVLLSLAEAVNEQGRWQEAVSYVNRVRNRAGVALLNAPGNTNTKVSGVEEMRVRIRNEKKWELACEEQLYFEELRWGTWKTDKFVAKNGLQNVWGAPVYTYIWGGDAYLKWAIPQSEVEKNTNIKQNEGWN